MPNNNETYITGLRVVKGRKKSQCLNLSNARIKSYAEIEQMTEEELQGVIICPDYPLEDGHLVPSSAIGYEDGTVEDALDDLYEAGNVRYNSETDRFEVKVNGTWVPSIKAYANNLILFDGTSFYATYENGVYKRASNYALLGGFTINLPSVSVPSTDAGNTCYTLAFANAIDVTEYSSLVVETSAGTLTVDISNVSQNVYIVLESRYSNAFDVLLVTNKTNYGSNIVTGNTLAFTSRIYITSVSLVK